MTDDKENDGLEEFSQREIKSRNENGKTILSFISMAVAVLTGVVASLGSHLTSQSSDLYIAELRSDQAHAAAQDLNGRIHKIEEEVSRIQQLQMQYSGMHGTQGQVDKIYFDDRVK